mmetsp:Transcript_39581/g.77920  ORF Transcript_39581/g.77920 Transcript_39581/m.77920 type:complete len:114 (+) Transcript_39581:399-740(+)
MTSPGKCDCSGTTGIKRERNMLVTIKRANDERKLGNKKERKTQKQKKAKLSSASGPSDHVLSVYPKMRSQCMHARTQTLFLYIDHHLLIRLFYTYSLSRSPRMGKSRRNKTFH